MLIIYNKIKGDFFFFFKKLRLESLLELIIIYIAHVQLSIELAKFDHFGPFHSGALVINTHTHIYIMICTLNM